MDVKSSQISLEVLETTDKKSVQIFMPKKDFQRLNVEKNSPEKATEFSESELELLNLIAELIVEIILKKTKNECDRICAD